MHVICKADGCGMKIAVASRPEGTAVTSGPVRTIGNAVLRGGQAIAIGGPGSGVSGFVLGPGGSIVLGASPPPSEFRCPRCKQTHSYRAAEIVDETP